MSFNSTLFLFLFLPVTLSLYFLARGRWKAVLALAASLVFYVWGNPIHVIPMAGIILLNFWLGRQIESRRGDGKGARNLLLVGVGVHVALLVLYRAVSGLGTDLLAQWGRSQYEWILKPPLGLSYIAFQAISYLVDVYEEKCPGEKNLLNFSLYILLFPRIIAGPITAYRDIRERLAKPLVNAADAAAGLRRFILGLAKKLLIADQIARIVDPVFSLTAPALAPASAWLVILAYSLQLFFDFSGYTDMAIGLGQTMGFRFPENFNLPYLAKTLSDFWRRWHMSLVSWFREYVFYRLEFARRKSVFFRQQINILVVFILTGLWHGFTLNFLIWGAMHGLILGLEMTRFGGWMKRTWPAVQHGYTLLVVLIGWVFFRSPTPAFALAYLQNMFRIMPSAPIPLLADLSPITYPTWIALAAGILFCFPVFRTLSERLASRGQVLPAGCAAAWGIARDALFLLLFLFSILVLVNSTHQAYIYMQF